MPYTPLLLPPGGSRLGSQSRAVEKRYAGVMLITSLKQKPLVSLSEIFPDAHAGSDQAALSTQVWGSVSTYGSQALSPGSGICSALKRLMLRRMEVERSDFQYFYFQRPVETLAFEIFDL